MIKRKRIFLWIIFCLLLIVAVSDSIRYLRPDGKKEQIITSENAITLKNPNKIMLAYNAWGGIVPGAVDFFHKLLLPSTYPCNLCYITYGTFVIKKDWKNFLDSLPFTKVYLHKDEVRKKYEPGNFPLPAILLSDSTHTKLLMSASEINNVHSLDSLMLILKNKLEEN